MHTAEIDVTSGKTKADEFEVKMQEPLNPVIAQLTPGGIGEFGGSGGCGQMGDGGGGLGQAGRAPSLGT